MQILIAEPINPILADRLEKAGYKVDSKPETKAEDLRKKIAEYDGLIIRSRFKITESILREASKLKFVARAGSGTENIDSEAATRFGVKIINSPEGNAGAVAEHALGLLLGLMHKINSSANEVCSGKWDRKNNVGDELVDKTIGIIGYGNTGSRFARLLSGFGTRILAYDKYKQGFGNEIVNESCPKEIFEKADIISFHVPLTEETRYLCNANYLSNFKKPVYLLNTSRGEVLDTTAVCDFLESGKLIAAGLDVLEYEKHNFENLLTGEPPLPLQKLIAMPNVIITPHIAGSSQQSVVKIASVLADKIIAEYGRF